MDTESKSRLLLTLAVIAAIVLGISVWEVRKSQEKVEVRMGTYVHGELGNQDFSKLELLKDNRYVFDRHIALNYRPTGEYVVQGHLLILRDGPTGDYVFEIRDENTLIFKGEDVIKKGTVFERVEEKE